MPQKTDGQDMGCRGAIATPKWVRGARLAKSLPAPAPHFAPKFGAQSDLQLGKREN